MVSDKDEQKLIALLQSIQEVKRLWGKRILKETEFHKIDKDIHDTLSAVLTPDSDVQREYELESRRTVWRTLDDNGFATDLGRLEFWEGFINKIINEKDGRAALEQVVIQPGEYFTARTAVRDVFSQASQSIAIFDEYLDDTEVLNIIEPYTATGVDGKLLKNAPRNSFVSDVTAMKKQYGHIELRSHVTQCHDRFVIIDDSTVYQFGHSLKNLGTKVTTITKLRDEEAKKLIALYDDWWSNAQVLV